MIRAATDDAPCDNFTVPCSSRTPLMVNLAPRASTPPGSVDGIWLAEFTTPFWPIAGGWAEAMLVKIANPAARRNTL